MFDAYQMATDRVCALLEQGIKPWAKPWTGVTANAWSGQNGRTYSLLNQILLSDPAKKYVTLDELFNDVRGEWLTFKQIQDRGGKVRKGEKGRKVVFFKMVDKPTGNTTAAGDQEVEQFPYLTAYTVFHIRQCDGIEQKYHTDDGQTYDFTADDSAEKVAQDYITREGITYNKVRGDRAYYTPELDLVVTPLPEQFSDRGEYYSTLFHELTHSTGHESRLNRLNRCASFGREEYSQEELVAEIGSASLCATMGIETPGSFTNSAAYIKSWLKRLRNDKRMVVIASGKAEKAVRMILNIAD